MEQHRVAILIVSVALSAGVALADDESALVNLAPLAGIQDSARTDGAKSGWNVNDEDPQTYWSAWPYTMRGDQDVITLDVVFPVQVRVHRVEIDEGMRSPEVQLSIRSAGRWRDHGAQLRQPASKTLFEWSTPIELDAMKFSFPRIRAERSGVVIREMRVMGELAGEKVSALSDAETPDLDWTPITDGISRSSGQTPVPWYEAGLESPQPVLRIELDWRGADYAKGTVLELQGADGQRWFVPRHRFSTSFTFERPREITRARLYCTQVSNTQHVSLTGLRLFGKGRPPSPPAHPQVELWPESALVKVRRDATGPGELSPFTKADPLRVSLVRNEYEAGQIIVRNNGGSVLRGVSIAVEELRSDSDTALSDIAVNPVAYVNGEYADVLLPSGAFRVTPGEVRPVWMTFHANADLAPGTYRGEAACRCAGKTVARLPIEVTVWDVTLPRETHFNTHYFSIWGTKHFLRDRLSDPAEAGRLVEEVADQFIRHRVSPGNPFVIEDYERSLAGCSWAEFVERFDRGTRRLLDGGLPFVGLLPGRQGLDGAPDSEEAYLQFWQQHLADRGWLDKFAVRVGDEPPPGNQRVTNESKKIKRIAPKLRRQCAFSSFGVGGTDTWVGLIDEWGVAPRVYNKDRIEAVVEFSRGRAEAGEGVSWYVHHVLSVDETPYFPRMFFWRLWKYRVSGALLYGVAEWAHRDVDRWEEEFVIHGTGFRTWGVLLWPAQGHLLDSVRFEAVRDGIEDWELHRLLEETIEAAARKNPQHPAVAEARSLLDDMDDIFVDLNADRVAEAGRYRIQDRHSDSPILCTNAAPADLLNARRAVVASIIAMRRLASEDAPAAPEWARLYTDGLRAWREIIYYWIDRQRPDGTFGFGFGEDCEMIVGWPGVMMAADDRRIERAIERLADNRWYNDSIQNGYVYLATEAEHGAEPTSYTQPVMVYQKFGSPKFIERLMITSKNVEHWTGITPRGDRHMRSTYFGSQQMREWPFYHEDSPINARTWLPMMHLLLYNRDPHLMSYFLEWTGAWAKHAMATDWGKPPGFLPGQVEFETGRPGGYTHNWWGAGAHDFNSLWYKTRLHGMLVVAYELTGDAAYIAPLRELMRFLSTYARPKAEEGKSPPPDRLPEQYSFPAGWREGDASTRYALDVARGHPGCWYYYATNDTQFDKKFEALLGTEIKRGPFERIDMGIVEAGCKRAESFRDGYFTNVVPKLKYGGSTANYAAAFWQKHYGTMTFGNRCFRDGGRLANSVNWPWVDYPPPAVVWKNTGYDTAIFVLEDSPQRFRVELCNVAGSLRRIGAQLFTLDEGVYEMSVGPDADEDGTFDTVASTDRVDIERGSRVLVELPPGVTTLLELRRGPASGPVPPWRPRPDLALDPGDIMVSKEKPSPGDRVTITVQVHNIGAKPAENVMIHLLGKKGDSQVLLADATLDRLDPPQRLMPSFAGVSFEWRVAEGVHEIGALLDPHDAVDELYENNNAAWVELSEAKPSQPVKRVIQHGPVVKPSLRDVTRTDLSRYDVRFRRGIKVDGLIGKREWHGIEPFEFLAHADGGRPKKRTWMKMAYDGNALYVAMRCEEPDLELLDTSLPRIDDIYYNDGFEIFLDPASQVWRYWQFTFDTVPHKFQTLSRNRYAPKALWHVAVAKGDGEWTAEVRFPFSSFDVDPPEPGSRWRMNAMRFTTTFRDPANPDRRIFERSHFSPKGKLHHHHKPELFGDLYFAGHADLAPENDAITPEKP